MRTIKLRGLKEGEWVYGGITSNLHSPVESTQIVTNEFMEGDEENEHYIFVDVAVRTIGQFTGLHDKNGIEIYEGDIYSRLGCTYVVEMPSEWGGFYWRKIYDDWTNKNVYAKNQHSWLSESDCTTCEIIGNIHENPELIEGKEQP